MKHPRGALVGALVGSLGATWSAVVEERLARFEKFLVDEAVSAGGIGPIQPEDVWRRHILDSLLFAAVVPVEAESVLDLGTGVGLPGIPLAIIRPASHLVLLDRSQRRADLCRRAVRILGLRNVDVVCADHRSVEVRFSALVMRAALPITDSWDVIDRLLGPGGVAAVGWSASGGPPDARTLEVLREGARQAGLDVEVIQPDALDSQSAILRITAT